MTVPSEIPSPNLTTGFRAILRTHAPWVFLCVGFLLVAVGFVLNSMWIHVLPLPLLWLAGIVLLTLLVSVVGARLLHGSTATLLLFVLLAAMVYLTGFSSCASVLVISLAAMGLGSAFVPGEWEARIELSILVGLALICGIVGWLLPYQLHFRAAYVAILLALIVVRWRTTASMLRVASSGWKSAVESAPRAAILATLALMAASVWAWMPATNYDDLAYHLALPSQLSSLGYYQMSAGSSLWAVAAWAGDVLQGIALLVAGGEAVGPINILWLMLTVGLLWKFCEALQLKPWLRWFALAIYASMPMTAFMLSGMHTEGPSAAVAIGLALLIEKARKSDPRSLYVIAILFGLLLGLKVSNVMIGLPLGLWLLWNWRGRLPWRALPLGLLLAIVAGGSSYCYAYLVAGNPVLPVFNEIFHSPYYPFANFHDTHWDSGFNWRIVWDIVFHTSRFIEGVDGSAGLVPLALAGCVLVAFFNRTARVAALVAIFAFVLPLTQIQYLRYAHPAFVLLIPVALCGMPSGSSTIRRAWLVPGALLLLVLSNWMFLAAPDSLLTYLTTNRQQFIDQEAPMRRISEVVRNRYDEQARVLITSRATPFAASFAGTAFVVNWYDQQLANLANEADRDDSGNKWLAILRLTGANLAVVRRGEVSEGLRKALLNYHATLSYEVGSVQLWELHGGVDGESLPAPAGSLLVQFDTSASPSGMTLVDVDVEIHCKPEDTPIVVGWKLTDDRNLVSQKFEWAICALDGRVHVPYRVASAHSVKALSMTAVPKDGADLGLQLLSARSFLRSDFMAERDLSSRARIIEIVKAANARRLAARRARRMRH